MLSLDDAPVVRRVRGLMGTLSDDEATLVRTLTPRGLHGPQLQAHLNEVVHLLATLRADEDMASFVYAFAPEWDGSIETLLLGGRVATLFERSELERVA
jgi:hypothetical protein